MSDEQLKFWTAVAGIIAAVMTPVGVVLAAWLVAKMNRVEKKVDGMTSDLVEAKGAQKLAEGQLQERDANRAYRDEGIHSTVQPDPLKVEATKLPEDVKKGS